MHAVKAFRGTPEKHLAAIRYQRDIAMLALANLPAHESAQNNPTAAYANRTLQLLAQEERARLTAGGR